MDELKDSLIEEMLYKCLGNKKSDVVKEIIKSAKIQYLYAEMSKINSCECELDDSDKDFIKLFKAWEILNN